MKYLFSLVVRHWNFWIQVWLFIWKLFIFDKIYSVLMIVVCHCHEWLCKLNMSTRFYWSRMRNFRSWIFLIFSINFLPKHICTLTNNFRKIYIVVPLGVVTSFLSIEYWTDNSDFALSWQIHNWSSIVLLCNPPLRFCNSFRVRPNLIQYVSLDYSNLDVIHFCNSLPEYIAKWYLVLSMFPCDRLLGNTETTLTNIIGGHLIFWLC